MRRVIQTFVVTAALLLTPALVRAEEYPIRFERPVAVGAKYQIKTTGTSTQNIRTTAGGNVVSNQEHALKVEMEATVEVLKVDEKGRPTQESYTIQKCSATVDGTASDVLKKGDVVMASVQGQETKLELKEGELSDEAKQALGPVIDLSTSKSSEDEQLGTKEKQKTGGSWPINAKAIAQDMKEHDITVDPKDIKGQSTLVGTKSVAGVPCLEIKSEVTATKFTIPMPLPPGQDISVKESSVKVEASGLYPQDGKAPPVARKMSMDMAVKAAGDVATEDQKIPIEVDVHITMSREATYTPVK